MPKTKSILILLATLLSFGLLLTACRLERTKQHGGQLYITSSPADATLICDGINMGQTPATVMNVATGEHLLILRKSGHREARATITMRTNERQAMDFKLEPINGLLLIISKPSGADISMDNVSMGKTPIFLHDTSLGPHRITVSTPGHLPRLINVNVADRAPQKIEINLTSDSARLMIETLPAGAAITLDGAIIGKTPHDLSAIASGKHAIELTLPGHLPFKKEFTVKAGDQQSIKTTLKPLPGKLTVLSSTPGARIYLDNQFKAEKSFTAEMPAGQYAIRVEARGFDQQTRTQTVAIGAESIVEFNLTKSSGTIMITTEPPGINIYMDGELRGTTQGAGLISEQLSIDFVPRGKRMIQFTRPGYFDLTATVDIQPDQRQIIHKKLKPRPVPFVPNTIIRTGRNAENTYRGIIRERFNNGNIKMEIDPGVFKTFIKSEILSIEAITNATAR